MAKVRLADVADLSPGELRCVDAGGVPLCLARLGDGTFHAIGDLCTHEDFQLSDGDLVGREVVCPAHGSRFDLLTGQVRGLPATVPASVYQVSVEGDDVYVDLQLRAG